MLSAYITPNIDIPTHTYSATIRFTSDEPFTYSKVVAGKCYRSTAKFEKHVIEGYTDDILFGPSREEESFSLDLFTFEKKQNRDFNTILIIQTNNTGEFEDLTPYYFYHKLNGLFKTSTDQAVAINGEAHFYSLFKPELIQEVLRNKFDFDLEVAHSLMVTSDSFYVISSDGKIYKIYDYFGNVVDMTVEEFEEMVASMSGPIYSGPAFITAEGKQLFTVDGKAFIVIG